MPVYCQTLGKAQQGEYQEKGSRFIAYAFPCTDSAFFAAYLNDIKEHHLKARHHCYAWRLGEYGQDWRVNDDGEPSGSAGLPIYNQMLSYQLSDTGVIVVRYFGGKLLGIPGLIRAYKTATQNALAAAEIIAIVPKMRITVKLEYAQIYFLMQIVAQFSLTICEQTLAMHCRYQLELNRDDYEAVAAALNAAGITIATNEIETS